MKEYSDNELKNIANKAKQISAMFHGMDLDDIMKILAYMVAHSVIQCTKERGNMKECIKISHEFIDHAFQSLLILEHKSN